MHSTGRRYLTATRVAINLLVFVAVAGLAERPAGAGEKLSFGDWLAVQSTNCKDFDGDGMACEPYAGQPLADQYIPANQSYLYFTAPAEERVAVIDWLGISGRYLRDECGVDLGTTTTGSVTAHDLKDGRRLVSVYGNTRNAMAFVVDGPGLDPFSVPLLFGAREGDICAGAEASLVDINFKVEYYTAASAEPIVDVQYFGFPDDPFLGFRRIIMNARGKGTLADGSPARLTMNQVGIRDLAAFPVESIRVDRVGR
jgi:hypothetical protein